MDLRFISKYKYNSVFSRTFLALVALTATLIVIFYLFCVRLVSDNLRETAYQSNLNMLGKTRDSVDLTLAYADQIISRLAQDPSIISLVVVPGLERYDRNFEVINSLSSAARQSDLIEEIFLYIPYDGSVFTSDEQVLVLEQFNRRELVDAFLANPYGSSGLGGEPAQTLVYQYGTDTYLVRDFPFPRSNRMGTLFCKLDEAFFHSLVQGGGIPLSEEIVVLDADGQALFGGASVNGNVVAGMTAVPGGAEYTARDGQVVFSACSEKSGWQYLYLSDAAIPRPSYASVLTLVLPLLALFSVLSILFSFYVSRSIYAPINRLTASIAGKAYLPEAAAKDEFELLRNAFDSTFDEKEGLSRMLRKVTPDVTEKLFRNLLRGHVADMAYVADTLEGIGSGFTTNGRYVVMAVQLLNSAGKSTTDLEAGLYAASAEHILRGRIGENTSLHAQLLEEGVMAVILQFSSDDPVLHIKQDVLELSRHLRQAARQSTFQVSVGIGRIYNSLEDIRFSYQEAAENMLYTRYLGESGPEPHPMREEPYFHREYFQTRVKQAVELIGNNDTNGARDLVLRVVREITSTSQPVQELQKYCQDYVDSIAEALFQLRIGREEEAFLDKNRIDRELLPLTDAQALSGYMEELCRKVITVMEESQRKRQHKYIVAALEYIDEHYSDSSLSLNMVAEHLGANSSYLSTLFKDNMNINFNDYLNSIRIQKAKDLLDTTRLAVKEVGFKTGFNSVQNFIRVFKKHQGATPGQYREQK